MFTEIEMCVNWLAYYERVIFECMHDGAPTFINSALLFELNDLPASDAIILIPAHYHLSQIIVVWQQV